jgi:hypothetical protein
MASVPCRGQFTPQICQCVPKRLSFGLFLSGFRQLHPDVMSDYLVRRMGKLLFPHLARDQRKNKMSVILLVLGTSLSVACILAMWMRGNRF